MSTLSAILRGTHFMFCVIAMHRVQQPLVNLQAKLRGFPDMPGLMQFADNATITSGGGIQERAGSQD